MVNISEFYNAGIGFSIVGEDMQFGEDGELCGLRTVVDANYSAGTGQEWERETLCGEGIEDGVLLDDSGTCHDEYAFITDGFAVKSNIPRSRCVGTKRWEHEREAYEAEVLAETLTLDQNDKCWDEDGKRLPVHGEMQWYAVERHRRYRRLQRFIAKQPRKRYGELRSKIWRRYMDSVRECKRTGSWNTLLLSKAQVTWIMELLRW